MLVAVVAGLLVLALVIYGILNLGSGSAGSTITGIVVEKKFTPQEETQITIGAGGVRSAEKKGIWLVQVKSNSDGEIYNVWLDEESFNRLQVGDPYQIPKAALDQE